MLGVIFDIECVSRGCNFVVVDYFAQNRDSRAHVPHCTTFVAICISLLKLVAIFFIKSLDLT